MEGTVARTLQVLIALSGAYLAALWVVLIVWTYRDIESRSRSVVTQAFSTMLSAFFFVPGVLLYMVLRPKETLDATFARSLEEEYLLQDMETKLACPNCHRSISEDYVVCPHCHTALQQPCVNCGRTFDVSWSVCPYCAHDKAAPAPSIRPVIQPLDRYVRSGRLSTIEELPASRMIEELESHAFYRLDTIPQPTAIPANTGRPFDRRKTREMHRARKMNDRVAERVTSNGSSPNGHDTNGNDDADD
jgi:RNA polymerase subunit RPABC4/transcription elongation factor Spt4